MFMVAFVLPELNFYHLKHSYLRGYDADITKGFENLYANLVLLSDFVD